MQTVIDLMNVHQHVADVATVLQHVNTKDTPNPLNGVSPNFTVFGVEFNQTWKKIVGGIWALMLLAAVLYLGRGILGIAQHRGGSHPQQLAESRSEAVYGGAAVGGLAGLGIIVGAILAIVG